MSIIQDAVKTAVRFVPDRWLPGASPDPLREKHGLLGAPVSRVDGPLKVVGQARFAAEVPMEGPAYATLVHSFYAIHPDCQALLFSAHTSAIAPVVQVNLI